MPISPDDKPKEFLTIFVAAGLLIFKPNLHSGEEALKIAEQFVQQVEQKFGKLNK